MCAYTQVTSFTVHPPIPSQNVTNLKSIKCHYKNTNMEIRLSVDRRFAWHTLFEIANAKNEEGTRRTGDWATQNMADFISEGKLWFICNAIKTDTFVVIDLVSEPATELRDPDDERPHRRGWDIGRICQIQLPLFSASLFPAPTVSLVLLF